ncbi:hypothetical protein FQN54_007877 [Arachnomyces sp. PD_36]|nr:hypothetical protein FQN54_007877 [Arachnomyces sp. PD_36]
MSSDAPPGRVPRPGIWVPAVTFFDRQTDTLDLISQSKYYTYLSQTGLAGLVILGTNAETFLLTREERRTLIETARAAVGPNFPLMAGVGGHSTRQVKEYIADAEAAGANYVLTLPPAYFGKATTPAVIKDFYMEVSRASSLPTVLYNFPGVCNGVDMDSDLIIDITSSASKVVGVKLTCGSVAKITRLVATFAPDEFAVFGGQSDFLIGGLSVGAVGCIAAFGNVFPKSIVRVFDLYKAGKFDEALALHRKAALAEVPCKAGIGVTKYAAAIHTARRAGIEGAEEKLWPRKPYPPPSEEQKERVRKVMDRMNDIEETL